MPVYSCTAHDSIINAIDGVGGLGIGGGAPEIVTGSRDGKTLIKGFCLPVFVYNPLHPSRYGEGLGLETEV